MFILFLKQVNILWISLNRFRCYDIWLLITKVIDSVEGSLHSNNTVSNQH